jgi:hypothetical protein
MPVSTLATIMTTLTLPAIGVAVVALAAAAYRLRDTTLMAPLLWAIFPNVLLAAGLAKDGTIQDAFTHIVAVTTFCAPLAILGAKRPQNRAWAFVIIAFLIISSGPQLLAILTDQQWSVMIVPAWIYYALLALGLVNYLPTRLCAAAGCWAAAQYELLRGNAEIGAILIPAASLLMVVSGNLNFARKRVAGWDVVWRDFRDLYGLTWALRVMDRANALAIASKSPVHLSWRGFRYIPPADAASGRGADITASAREIAPLETGLCSLFRRFVSQRWIDARRDKG